MEFTIELSGKAKVDAHFGQFTVKTDQPLPSGDDSAPSPFLVFLSSIGTCAGIYVMGFLQQRNLPAEGVRIIQRVDRDPSTGMVETIDLEIQVPQGFPPQYYDAVVRSAELCLVKKHLEHPPRINVFTKVV